MVRKNLHFDFNKKMLSKVLCFAIIITQMLQSDGKLLI